MPKKPAEFNPLIDYLTKEVKKERWLKKPRVRGSLVLKRATKAGNLVLEIMGGEALHKVIVLKKNTNLFTQAESLRSGEKIFVIGWRYLGKFYAERITMSRKDETQTRMGEYAP